MPTLAALIDAYEHPGREVGAYCKNGHERAVYERRYARSDGTLTRCCLLCQRAREKQQRERRTADRRAFAAQRHPDAVLWDAFCRDVEQRIQAVRAQTPRCGECGRSG